jgi:G:T-mismatch repair DNA endonuclease (very short patch repair protein)
LEKDIYAILREEGIPFTREKTIGRCHADIFIEPFTVVELQGCYWHGCPKCYKTLSKMQKNAQAKDARRFYFFDKLGFDTQVIWECELEKNPAAVRAKLCNLYEKAA